ncbi:hypothetical protein BO70DRAFT_364007 [Aspergillus heteromorphus CBS 117.55]|uniref:Uncharacterized protein n=1 Tax=Aspergillus heteromorphus CBS 117.55 TaxID=1448321 RepID=A0A317VM40_9EURO|nr:uncharacterized protein BO70DRAFT_364007 [Aspergillus heteromorphus CBS 117.55]PWY75443.1 hypothetical protein BO70DRAFT_364007 [Aspergillus heteromorphus CBS 117.55]
MRDIAGGVILQAIPLNWRVVRRCTRKQEYCQQECAQQTVAEKELSRHTGERDLSHRHLQQTQTARLVSRDIRQRFSRGIDRSNIASLYE